MIEALTGLDVLVLVLPEQNAYVHRWYRGVVAVVVVRRTLPSARHRGSWQGSYFG